MWTGKQPRQRKQTDQRRVAIITLLLLSSLLLLPGAAPVLCVSTDHVAFEGFTSHCCLPTGDAPVAAYRINDASDADTGADCMDFLIDAVCPDSSLSGDSLWKNGAGPLFDSRFAHRFDSRFDTRSPQHHAQTVAITHPLEWNSGIDSILPTSALSLTTAPLRC